MKHMEQLDAHVQSYRNAQKQNERERIRAVFQYLEKKREQLSLQKQPAVNKIHYNVRMFKPVRLMPFSIKKIKVDSRISLKKEHLVQHPNYGAITLPVSQTPEFHGIKTVVPKFGAMEYKLETPKIELDEFSDVEIPKNKVSYSFEGDSISLNIVSDVAVRQNYLLKFSLPEQASFELETPPQITGTQEIKHSFVVPDIPTVITPLQVMNVPSMWTDYKMKNPNVKLRTFPVLPSTLCKYSTDFQKHFVDKKIKLKHVELEVPEFATVTQTPEIPRCNQTFAQPNFDFSDVMEKLRNALMDELS